MVISLKKGDNAIIMKKYLSLLLSVCLLLLSLPAAAESTDGINIDFNTLSEGAVPEGWSAVATSPDSVGAVEVEPGNMAMYLNEGSGSNNEVSLTSPTFNYDKFTVSYKVKFDNTSVYQGFYGNEATTLNDVFNNIMPGLMPLLFTLLVYYLLKKKNVKTTTLLLICVVIGLFGAFFGILGC